MCLGFFLLFGWESLLNKKKNRAKKTFGQPLHKKSDSLSGRFIITNELFEPLDLKNWEEIWSSQNPCERRKEGPMDSRTRSPWSYKTPTSFTALPRACKVRRGADTWYTIARPTATTSSGNRPGTREPPQRLGKPLKLFRKFFFTKKDRGSFYDIKQTQRKYLLIDGNPSRHRFASTLIPSQMGGV